MDKTISTGWKILKKIFYSTDRHSLWNKIWNVDGARVPTLLESVQTPLTRTGTTMITLTGRGRNAGLTTLARQTIGIANFRLTVSMYLNWTRLQKIIKKEQKEIMKYNQSRNIEFAINTNLEYSQCLKKQLVLILWKWTRRCLRHGWWQFSLTRVSHALINEKFYQQVRIVQWWSSFLPSRQLPARQNVSPEDHNVWLPRSGWEYKSTIMLKINFPMRNKWNWTKLWEPEVTHQETTAPTAGCADTVAVDWTSLRGNS